MQKTKLGTKTLWKIFIPIIIVLIVTCVVVTAVMNYFAASLDTYLGRGTRRVANAKGTENWDLDYYNKLYSAGSDSRNAGFEVSKKVTDEGIVLLKNDGALPLSKDTAIMPIGYRYSNAIHGGTGSGTIDASLSYVVTPEKGLKSVFKNVSDVVKQAMAKAKVSAANPLTDNNSGSDNYSGARTSLPEYKKSVYESVASQMKNTVGIVYLGRVGGEGGDVCATAYDDGTKHELALTVNEKDMLDVAKANCSKVIVVLETSNAMELAELEDDDGINAVLQVGGSGCSGFGSLAQILAGEINPSGRLVDIYYADFTKDPTYVNFDKNLGNGDASELNWSYSNVFHTYGERTRNVPFREYEEGVYMGYRFYETASALGYFTSDNLPDGETDKYYNRDNGVVYPFGYGLSYTTFEQRIDSIKTTDKKIELEIEVKNNGTADGKDVVQVYYSAPYTSFDVSNKIEKPAAVLVGFAKTPVIKAGESKNVKIEFAVEDMASYCYTRENGDGTRGAYVLENGDYEITLRKNSHEVIDSRVYSVAKTIWYDYNNPRESEILAQSAMDENGNYLSYPMEAAVNTEAKFKAASNGFEKANTYMNDKNVSGATILTRNDWSATQPSEPTDKDRNATETVVNWNKYNLDKFDIENDVTLGNKQGSKAYKAEKPTSQADNSLTLADMRGKDYYDKSWDDLLDQLDYTKTSELNKALFMAAYTTGEIKAVGKPTVIEHDGPAGLMQSDNNGNSWTGDVCGYPSEVLIAQTFNVDLAYEIGYALGQESLTNGNNGWYAPGTNIHRSPFGGRNFEYYSEDPLIGGKFAAATISGAGDCGVYSTLKHFALNDQEAQRKPDTGLDINVWATEQAIREIYLKVGEIAIKEARKTIKYVADENGTIKEKTMRAADGIMAGDCAPGGEYTAYNYNLMTEIVRNEWGFRGFVVTDMHISQENDIDRMVRAGCDLQMSLVFFNCSEYKDYNSASGQWALRNAVKNYCYAIVNSNAMQGAAPGAIITYGMSPWAIWLTVANVVVYGFSVAVVVFLVLRGRKES